MRRWRGESPFEVVRGAPSMALRVSLGSGSASSSSISREPNDFARFSAAALMPCSAVSFLSSLAAILAARSSDTLRRLSSSSALSLASLALRSFSSRILLRRAASSALRWLSFSCTLLAPPPLASLLARCAQWCEMGARVRVRDTRVCLSCVRVAGRCDGPRTAPSCLSTASYTCSRETMALVNLVRPAFGRRRCARAESAFRGRPGFFLGGVAVLPLALLRLPFFLGCAQRREEARLRAAQRREGVAAAYVELRRAVLALLVRLLGLLLLLCLVGRVVDLLVRPVLHLLLLVLLLGHLRPVVDHLLVLARHPRVVVLLLVLLNLLLRARARLGLERRHHRGRLRQVEHVGLVQSRLGRVAEPTPGEHARA